jgi:MFS family permease
MASVLIVVFGLGVFGFNIAVMAPLVAREIAGGPAEFGLVTMLAGAGSIAASLIALAVRQITVRRILLGATALAVSLLLIGLAPAGRLAVLTEMFLFGLAGTMLLTAASTMVQLLARHELEGSIMGLYLLGVVGTTPLGSLLLGLLAHRLGPRVALTIMGFACMLVVLAAAVHARRHGALQVGLPSPARAER